MLNRNIYQSGTWKIITEPVPELTPPYLEIAISTVVMYEGGKFVGNENWVGYRGGEEKTYQIEPPLIRWYCPEDLLINYDEIQPAIYRMDEPVLKMQMELSPLWKASNETFDQYGG